MPLGHVEARVAIAHGLCGEDGAPAMARVTQCQQSGHGHGDAWCMARLMVVHDSGFPASGLMKMVVNGSGLGYFPPMCCYTRIQKAKFRPWDRRTGRPFLKSRFTGGNGSDLQQN